MSDITESRDRILEAVLAYLEARKKIPTCPHDRIYNPMVQRIEAELGLVWSDGYEDGRQEGFIAGAWDAKGYL